MIHVKRLIACVATAMLLAACDGDSSTAEGQPANSEPAKSEPTKSEPTKSEASPQPGTRKTAAEIKEVSVEHVAALLSSGEITPVDVSEPRTRKANGILPGAVLLSWPLNVEKELTVAKDAPVVFYCIAKY